MSTVEERMVKMAANKKKTQQPKKKTSSSSGITKPGAMVSPAIAKASSSSPKVGASVVGSPVSKLNPSKRTRMDDTEVVDVEELGKKFVFPYCFGEEKLFTEKLALKVPPSETAIIRDMGTASRRKVLAEDMAALLRMAETALVLNEEGSASEAEIGRLRSKNNLLEARITKLELENTDLREKAKVHADTLKECNRLEGVLAQLGKEKGEVEAKLLALEAAHTPVEGEPEDAQVCATRADFVQTILRLEGDCVSGAKYAFKNAVAQLELLNPGLEFKKDGMAMLKRVVNGELVPLPGYQSDEDSEEEGEHPEEHQDESNHDEQPGV